MQSKKAYELVTTGRPDDPAFPHAMVLTVSFVISPVIGLCCHRRFARLSATLDASVEASGPHDFAVRVQHRSSAVLTIASIASRPASVTIASAPWWDETARLGRCFASERKQDIFAQRAGQVICENARRVMYGRPPVGKAFLVFRQTDRGAVMYTASRCGRWPRALMENADRIPIIAARCYAR